MENKLAKMQILSKHQETCDAGGKVKYL